MGRRELRGSAFPPGKMSSDPLRKRLYILLIIVTLIIDHGHMLRESFGAPTARLQPRKKAQAEASGIPLPALQGLGRNPY
jgi:hypothetical protein